MRDSMSAAKLLKCKCGRYTLKKTCPLCGGDTKNPHAPRFSSADKYGAYRRKLLYGH